MSPVRRRLLDWARVEGRRRWDAAARTCVGPRDRLGWAMALMHGDDAAERRLGDELLRLGLPDATHSPATALAVLLA